MYTPPVFMTMDVLAGVLAEFEWPAPYTLEDELPDDIWMNFPKCHLGFSEGFESEMRVVFSTEDTHTDSNLTLDSAIVALQSTPGFVDPYPNLKLIKYFSPQASLVKVQNQLRDLCTLILAYLQPCILGDFSWVESYRKQRRSP